MDFQRFSEITSPQIDINKKISKMSDIEHSATSELSAGFSTPPSSSLDTCDSGFNDLYSNSFTLISSARSKCSRTTPAQLDQSESSSESAQLFDDNSIPSRESQNTTPHIAAEQTAAASSDRPAPFDEGDASTNEAQLDLNNLDYDHTTDTCARDTTTPNSSKFAAENDADDYNDDSNMSDISDLSDVFKLNSDIMPEMQRSIDWVHLQIASGVNPREYLSRIFQNTPKQTIPDNVTDNDLWRVIAAILSDPPRRQRLQHIQTIEDVCETIKKSKNIIVLTGAGVSVSCGIPDFRSRDGIYERLRVEYPDMRDPQSMFDIGYFARDPRPFYQFAKEIYPGQFQPSLSHRFIKLLERKGKLLRNYTQNIDTLERVAGIENVIECHGSFATASCTRCKFKVDAIDIQDDILHQRIPMCKVCETSKEDDETSMNPRPDQPFNYNQLVLAGVMKPDIVFFGESLPDKFHSTIELDKTNCDLLIVIGSSLKVRPVALIPSSISQSIPQILINREQLDHFVFDVELLGDSDVIINHLMHALGEDWSETRSQPPLKQTNELILSPLNVHNIPPLLANAVIKKPHQPTSDSMDSSAASAFSGNATSDESQSDWQSTSQNDSQDESTLQEHCSTESFPSMANFLPDNSFFYNDKSCYIFPGAEIWWNKDSDAESTSSDSSIHDDDDDDDMEEMELSAAERNEMMSDVETTIAVESLLENTSEHEFNKYLVKRKVDEGDAEESDSPKRLKICSETAKDQPADSREMCDSNSSSEPTPQNEVFSPKL